jgi:hypothetical protein
MSLSSLLAMHTVWLRSRIGYLSESQTSRGRPFSVPCDRNGTSEWADMTRCKPDELLVQVWRDAVVRGKEESMLEFKRRALVVVSLIIIIYKYGQPFLGLSNLVPSILAWD